MKREHIFLTVIGAMFVVLTIVFLSFPRSRYSELERRELADFPMFTIDRLLSGSFTRDVSSWFSDTQPFRDRFMSASMELKSRMALNLGDDQVAFHASAPEESVPTAEAADSLASGNQSDILEPQSHAMEDGVAKMANRGIIIVGSGPETRALMAFGGSGKGGEAYARMVNRYQQTLGPDVRVYCMIVPTAAEFYTPAKARSMTNPQQPTISHIYSLLEGGAAGVDAYTQLARHAGEPVYLRTDHHWSPLGAYYAAEEFARTAGVPFNDLSHYDTHTVRNFVGTMYGYSKDPAIKDAPEDFVYYTPQDESYSVTFVTLTLDKDFNVVGESRPYAAKYFRHYKDGSSAAYSTFMGGDYNQTVVRTPVANKRRLLVIKDSYGNAVPGYLFSSFEEIHVIDHRYFRHAVKNYVRDNGITDVLLINNIFNAYSSHVARRYDRILDRPTPPPAEPRKPEAAPAPEPAPADTAVKPVETVVEEPEDTLSVCDI